MNVFAEVRALPRITWLLAATTFVNRMGTMVMPFIVLYLGRKEAVGTSEAGFVVAMYGIGAVVISPVAGRLVDRFGGRIVLQGSMLSAGTLCFAMPFVHGFVPWLVMAFVFACAAESLWPASLTLVGASVPSEQRTIAFSFQRLAGNLGFSIGPVIGGLLASHDAFDLLFVVDGASSIVAGLILVLGRAPDLRPEPEPAEEGGLRGALDRRLVYFLVALFPVAAVFYQNESTMAVHTVEVLGHSASFYGFLFTISTAMVVLFQLPVSAATSHWRHEWSLALGAWLISIGYGLLVFVTDQIGVAFTVVVWTLGELLLLPACSAYVSDIAPKGREGSYMGWYSMVAGMAAGLGPFLGMLVLGECGPRVLWIGAFAIGTVSAAMLTQAKVRAS